MESGKLRVASLRILFSGAGLPADNFQISTFRYFLFHLVVDLVGDLTAQRALKPSRLARKTEALRTAAHIRSSSRLLSRQVERYAARVNQTSVLSSPLGSLYDSYQLALRLHLAAARAFSERYLFHYSSTASSISTASSVSGASASVTSSAAGSSSSSSSP